MIQELEEFPERRGANSHRTCMACGESSSLGLKFEPNETGVMAEVSARPDWQGYAGILHGGMICTLLDAAMTHCLFQQGIEAMTAEMTVRFIRPVPCCGKLQLTARLLQQRRHLYQLAAELSMGEDVLARGEARFFWRNQP